MGFTYFTELIVLGKWKCRQFIKQSTTIGINRNKRDILTINNENGIDGFSSDVLSGKSRLLLTLQTQLYAPWNVLGFHFGPFLTYSIGMLNDHETSFHKSRVYSLVGIGFLIKNENLIFNTFQVSLSFYPIIPGRGNNILKVNSLKTTDFGLRDFGISKPGVLEYK